jgi:serine/threonine-protein kinase
MDTTLSQPTGQLLDGRYLVESRIAHGGMATVYLGRDLRLDRAVALKIAHQELAGDQEFVRRFITEARAAAQLSSPNVVAVFDQGSVGELHYIAMEYVPGPTLRDVLRAHAPLSVRESLDVLEGVLAGLAAAHRAGIVHRDVKPENVLLGRDHVVKVADFGLARAAAAVARTTTGMIIGTAAYLAPEQVSASTSDARTDVYAAGVMLFEMLTGTQPHTGESPLAVAYKHVNDVVPPPSSRAPGLPPALDALVALATSRDPDLRPSDAGQFLHAVTEVRHGAPVSSVRRGQHAAPSAPPESDGWRRGDGPARHRGADDHLLDDTDLGPAVSGLAPGPGGAGLGGAGLGGLGLGGMAGDRGSDIEPLTSQPIGRHQSGGGSYDAPNHTLVVSAGTLVPGFGDGDDDHPRARRRGSDRYDREPPLQRLLFSRRLFYVLGGLAVVLGGVLVTWWLTAGQYTKVPQVGHLPASQAAAELRSAHLQVRDGRGQHSDIPRGHVVSTSPAGGARIQSGGTVTIVVSLGPVMIEVPQVTGMPLAEAQSQLKAKGLTPGKPKETTSTTIPAGIVISTSPVAGTAWPKDKPVGISVSAGPPLPDFTGQQLAQAQATAQAGGYTIQPVTAKKSDQPANTVLRQSPEPGTPVTHGEVVTVFISPGPPAADVPNVTGMKADDAVRTLEAAGFKVQVNRQGPGDQVFGYGPNGSQPLGTTITINVGFNFGL